MTEGVLRFHAATNASGSFDLDDHELVLKPDHTYVYRHKYFINENRKPDGRKVKGLWKAIGQGNERIELIETKNQWACVDYEEPLHFQVKINGGLNHPKSVSGSLFPMTLPVEM
jgi:hypothetical protein